MFQVKICGVTSAGDAEIVAAAGADAVGLNFYPNSPRFVSSEAAWHIVRVLPARISKVGVFVNAAVEVVVRVAEDLGLDFVQLHGDEPPRFVAEVRNRHVLRAFRLGAVGLQPIREYLDECRRLDAMPKMVLLDSHRAGQFGGTGIVADWGVARQFGVAFPDVELVLAGGLVAENVADAIYAVRPTAVDTASGVESAIGRKDPAKVAAFIAAARAAFAGQAGMI